MLVSDAGLFSDEAKRSSNASKGQENREALHLFLLRMRARSVYLFTADNSPLETGEPLAILKSVLEAIEYASSRGNGINRGLAGLAFIDFLRNWKHLTSALPRRPALSS